MNTYFLISNYILLNSKWAGHNRTFHQPISYTPDSFSVIEASIPIALLTFNEWFKIYNLESLPGTRKTYVSSQGHSGTQKIYGKCCRERHLKIKLRDDSS